MITALVLVFVFAALMFLVAAVSANWDAERSVSSYRTSILRRRRDRALTVALALFSVVIVLALAGVVL